jgi:hypothetical protein
MTGRTPVILNFGRPDPLKISQLAVRSTVLLNGPLLVIHFFPSGILASALKLQSPVFLYCPSEHFIGLEKSGSVIVSFIRQVSQLVQGWPANLWKFVSQRLRLVRFWPAKS